MRFDLRYPFLGTQNFLLPLFQLWRRKAFGVGECLPPLVIIGNTRNLSLRYLYVVTKNAVESDLQIANAGTRLFLIFKGSDRLFRGGRNRANFIQLRVKSMPYDAAVARIYRRFVGNSSADEVADLRQLENIFGKHLQK